MGKVSFFRFFYESLRPLLQYAYKASIAFLAVLVFFWAIGDSAVSLKEVFIYPCLCFAALSAIMAIMALIYTLAKYWK